jgi:hypothetical protein
MVIELTERQQQELDSQRGTRARVIDPRTNLEYLLIPLEDVSEIEELIRDDADQRAIRRVGLRNAAGRAGDEP